MEDSEILKKRIKMFNNRKGARVGDFLKYKNKYVRFSYDWGDSLQTALDGSFYFGNGYISFSGSLNHGINKNNIEQTKEKRKGRVWFFHNDIARGGNGRDFIIKFKVFKVKNWRKVKDYNIFGSEFCPQCKRNLLHFNYLGCFHECLKCSYSERKGVTKNENHLKQRGFKGIKGDGL